MSQMDECSTEKADLLLERMAERMDREPLGLAFMNSLVDVLSECDKSMVFDGT
jgi:hypothetical protein